MEPAETVTPDKGLEALLDHLKLQRGFDFSGYKRASLERRIAKRIEAVGVDGYDAYLDHLEVHPDEFDDLFNTILINVTGFFRDGSAWDYIVSDVLPRVVDARGPDGTIRVWCAGCASGEETFTLAMLLAEALGEDEYARRVKIYATDVDEEALDAARQATYSAKQLEEVPVSLRDRYFDRHDQHYMFRKELRRTVIFGRNDLVRDAPISRVDLLLCRNTLMYFTAETQARILRRFHFALNKDGFLFLGRSEMLISHGDLFQPVSLKRRVFAKTGKPTLRERLLFTATDGDGAAPADIAIREGAFDATPVPQMVVDRDGILVLANDRARSLLGITAGDVGRPANDLEASLRPVDLRASLQDVLQTGRVVTIPAGPLNAATPEHRALEVQLSPVRLGADLLAVSVAYIDITGQRRAQEELERSRHELSTAYEELQSTVEELETTNEELQSTNEELETTNEELQSTNEELETMNEELQSTNEELETMNDELRERTFELDEVNALMERILTDMGLGVMVLDQAQHVRIWNQHAEHLWGLRSEEVERQHVLNLDIGFPVDELRQPLRQVLGGEQERVQATVPATDRRGREFTCRATVLPLSVAGVNPAGAIVLMERAGEDPDSDGV
jgi:two-component system CheB/CheR fusion protein